MRYEDTSGSFSQAGAGMPDARDDTDNMAAGSRSPATGNAISGEGTVTGAAGADIIGNAPGHIVALQGANGSDTADSGGSLQAAGRYGTLTMNQDGGYSYRTNGAAPENARDVFSYTLADQSGGRDTALLAIDIGHTPSVADNAQQIVPGPDGVVTLPPGVELSDVHVVGRNLVIDMPDGSQMVIIDGAVFVPQLVLNGVEVPSSNLAALLIDSEPKPAAGTPQSGGGNFAVDVGPLDPGVPLGDLLPPTNLSFTPPEFEEVFDRINDEPEIIIIPDGQPGAVNAVDSVDESGLPERGAEPEGTLESQNIETTTGVISISAEDGIDSVTINGVEIDSVGDTVVTARGVLTITSINLDSGDIGYSYTATDNTTDGVDDFDDFTIVVTDDDGDTATGTLHIDILDDEPIARDDTDSVTTQNPTATGNVMTAVGTTNSPAGVDTVGADNATLTAVAGAGGSDSTFDGSGNLVVDGQLGTLTIKADGSYTYVADGNSPGGTDVFTYTLTDGDGDTATATLTITVPADQQPTIDVPTAGEAGTVVDEAGLPARGSEPEGSGEELAPGANGDPSETTSGTITFTPGDGPATVTIDGLGAGGPVTITGAGQVIQGQYGTLTITSYNAATGIIQYSYTLNDNTAGDATHDDFSIVVTDSDGDTASSTLTIDIIDDTPIARNDTDSVTEGNPIATGNVMTASGTTNSPAGFDTVGADDSTLTAVRGVGPTDTTFDINGNLVVQGQYGQLTIDADGNYTYELTGELPEAAANDVFTYTLTDGDGDTSTATLTISVPGNPDEQPQPDNATAIVDDDGLPTGNHDDAPGDDDVPDNDLDNNEATFSGTLTADFGGDGPGTFTFADMDGDTGQVGQEAVVYSWDDATDTLKATVAAGEDRAGTVLFTVHLDPNGTFEVTLENNILHENTGVYFENDAFVDLTFTAVDADGDPTPGTLTITFDDDVPTARGPVVNPQNPNPPPLLGGRVDEDDLNEENGDNTTGNDDHLDGDDEPIDASGDTDATTTGGGIGSLGVLFNPGADRPLTFSLKDDQAAIDSMEAQNLTSNGHPLVYDIDGGLLTAVADLNGDGTITSNETIFTLTVNSDGSWLFNLQGQLDHSEPGTEDNLLIDFGSVIVGTDADGDPVAAGVGVFVIDVDDDMPQPWNEEDCPKLEVVNGPSDVTDPLSLNLPNIGADQPAKLTFGFVNEEGDVVLVADGDLVRDTEGNPLTSDGSPLHYEVIDADTLQAVNADGDPVFEINLIVNADGTGSYTYEQFQPIDNGSGSVSFDNLTGTNAGNAQFQGVGADDPETTIDLLISAEKDGANDTVNTDNDSIGSQNQSMDDGETVRIDFVQNLTEDTGDADAPPSGFNYGAHVGTNSFIGEIPQVQGDQDQTVAFTVWALDTDNTDAVEPDRNPDGGFDDADSVQVTEVTVKDYLTGNTTSLAVAFTDGTTFVDVAYGISVRVNADGSVTFSGIQEGDSYGVSTGSENFNAIAVQAEPAGTGPGEGSTNESFDLGVFAIGSVDSGEPVDISVPVLVTDADGDPVSCDIEITLNPGTSVANAAGTVNEAALDTFITGDDVAAGTVTGSDPDSAAETVTIDLADSVGGGSGTLTFALVGDTDHDGVVEGAYGTLTLNPDGHTVTYTLTDPVDGPGADDGANPITGLENFDFTVTDDNGTTTSTVKITIIDDVPTAEDDSNSVNEGGSVGGDVVANDESGADGYAPSPDGTVTGIASVNQSTSDGSADGSGDFVLEGEYGTLTLNRDGTYTYQADPNTNPPADATDVFTYTIIDADGDTDEATLTIDVNDVTIPADNQTQTVNEAALDLVDDDRTGTLNDDLAAGTVTGSNPASGAETVSGQLVIVGVGATGYTAQSVTTANGVFQLNVDGSYTYTLTTPVDGTTADNSTNTVNAVEVFNYSATDSGGNTVNGTITINVVDDVPTAFANTNTVTEGASVLGNVLTDGTDDVFGADGQAPGGGVTGVATGSNTASPVSGNIGAPLIGAYGTLTLNANGTYSYDANPDVIAANQVDHFVYTITDGDGDTSTVTLDITVNNVSLSASDSDALVNEAGLPVIGSNPSSTSEVFNGSITPSGGTGPYTYALTSDANGAYGNLVLNADGTYTYTLDTPYDGATADNGVTTEQDRDSFNYTVTDANGNTTTGTILVDIIDDVPTDFQPDEAVAENTGTDVVTGFLDNDDTLSNDDGADGLASLTWNTGVNGTTLLNTDGQPVTVNGQPVKLYVQPDGSLVATTDISSAAAKVFTATLNAGTSEYTIDFDRPLDNGSTSASDFSAVEAGNTPWKGFDPDVDALGNPIEITESPDPNPNSTDLLFTPVGAATINNDNDDIGTGGGQKVNPNEALRIDMVQDLRYDPGVDESTAGGYLYDNHVAQKVFSFTMVDTQSGADASVLVKAWDVTDGATAQSNVNDAGINTQVDIDPNSIVVKLGSVTLVEGTDYEVYESGMGVYIEGIPEGAVVTFQASGTGEFDAVTIENASGDARPAPATGTIVGAAFGLGGFSYGVNDPGDPVEFTLPVLLTDGDGDTSDGTIPVTVYPVGEVPEPFAATSSLSLAKTSSVESVSLLADDSSTSNKTHGRSFDAANNNSMLLGAIAAAGLASAPAAASNSDFSDDLSSLDLSSLTADGASKQSLIEQFQANHALAGESQEAADDGSDGGNGSRGHSNDNAGDHSLTSGETQQSDAPAELLAGTDTPQQDAPAQSMLTSQSVAMPSAEMLEAAKGAGSSEVEGKSNAMVEQVLADALAGGGDGANIEAVIDAIANQDGGLKAVADALASHGNAAVSHWDTAGLAGFPGGHAPFTMEAIQLHHDAVQPAA